jgi:uncharacterized protein (DUF2252 family)
MTMTRALTVAERAEFGKNLRTRVPRSSQDAVPSFDRDPITLLERQALTRVPELVPIRHGRMAVSPFTFYRGAALGMAQDLAATPTTGLDVQACGDAHLSNFGMYASPERRLVFDINDFDETTRGPWEWDVKRLVASLEVAGRANGFAKKERRIIALEAAMRYRLAMRRFATLTNLEVWYSSADSEALLALVAQQVPARRRRMVEEWVSEAHARDNLKAFKKLTQVVDGETRILSDAPLLVALSELLEHDQEARAELEKLLGSIIESYARTLQPDRRVLFEQYRFVDLARKVVGVGSVGTRCWVALFVGGDNSDPLFLQVKEAEASVLEEFVGRSEYEQHGERVVNGQRLMQAVSDIFLGWERHNDAEGATRDYYMRQLRDWKASVPIELLEPNGMRLYGELCAWTLARAHARSGDRIAIAAYLGTGDQFEQAISRFAPAYADQNERDHQALVDAIASGRLSAMAG